MLFKRIGKRLENPGGRGIVPTMKPVLYLLPVALALIACRREETAGAPKAVEVEESKEPVVEDRGSREPS